EGEPVQPADGKPTLGPQFLGRERPDLGRAAIARDVYAIPAGGKVIAVNSGAGGERWTMNLPRAGDETWRIRATRTALLLHPGHALGAKPSRPVRELTDMPTLDNLQLAANMMYYGWSRPTFPPLPLSP